MTRPIVDLDVSAADAERQIARDKFQRRMDHLAELLAHPEIADKHGASGELKEQRHWLHDADPDSPFPAFRVNLIKRPKETL